MTAEDVGETRASIPRSRFALNFIRRPRDQGQALIASAGAPGGQFQMESIRPETTDPIPLRSAQPQIGTIMIRFIGLLVVAIGILAFVYSR